MDIKTAVEIVKKSHPFVDKYGYNDPSNKEDVALKFILDFLSSLAEVEMPKKKEHFAVLSNKDVSLTGELIEGRTIQGWKDYGYNQALDDCLAYFSKREAEWKEKVEVEKMSEITTPFVEEFFPKGQCRERGQALVLHAEMLIALSTYLTEGG